MIGHLPELVIILVVALIVFGPEKLPEAAASAGKAVRELRQVMESALHPQDEEVTEDFSTYYYESLERSGEENPDGDEDVDPYGAVEMHDGDDEPTDVATGPVINADSVGSDAIHKSAEERLSRAD